MYIELLRKVGLSEGEIKAYEALLQLGPASANQIHEKVGIERRNVYDILNKLIERGLVTYIDENKKRTFSLAHPRKILGYIEEKIAHLEDIKKEVEKDIAAVIKTFEASKPSLSAEVYRGMEGIKAVWEEMLNHKEIRWIGSGNYVPTKFPVYWHNWNKRRREKKIESYHLFRHEFKWKMIENVGKAKFLPLEFSKNPTVIAVFGNKVVNFLFGEELFAFVIESQELAENYQQYHEYLWNKIAIK